MAFPTPLATPNNTAFPTDCSSFFTLSFFILARSKKGDTNPYTSRSPAVPPVGLLFFTKSEPFGAGQT
jgi:hypothetical protein